MLRRVPANMLSRRRKPFGQPGMSLQPPAGAVPRPQPRLGGEPDVLLAVSALTRAPLAQPFGHRQPLAQVVVGDIASEVSLLDHRSPFMAWRVDGHIIERSQRG